MVTPALDSPLATGRRRLRLKEKIPHPPSVLTTFSVAVLTVRVSRTERTFYHLKRENEWLATPKFLSRT
jgi:hypothetical protein